MVMSNIEEHCRTSFGYGAYKDVTKVGSSGKINNSMESFFLAETLKYHYLLQNPEMIINLREWVFNTETHPLKIFK